MHRGGVHHLLAARCHAEISYGLDGTHAHAAVEAALEALPSRCEKVAGPAVEADAVDEVGWPLGGFQVVLAAGIVGIADAAVAVAVVDAVLAPDLPLADMDALFGGEVSLVLGIHKACHQALRAIFAADHGGDHAERLVDRLAIIGARVVHGREIAAGDEGDLVAVVVVIGGEKPACVFVLLPGVVQRQPTDRPGHSAVSGSLGQRLLVANGCGRGCCRELRLRRWNELG